MRPSAHNPKRDCFPSALQRGIPDRLKQASTVKRLCIKCTRLTSPDGFAYTLRGYTCMCLACDAEVTDNHSPMNAGSDDYRRIEA